MPKGNCPSKSSKEFKPGEIVLGRDNVTYYYATGKKWEPYNEQRYRQLFPTQQPTPPVLTPTSGFAFSGSGSFSGSGPLQGSGSFFQQQQLPPPSTPPVSIAASSNPFAYPPPPPPAPQNYYTSDPSSSSTTTFFSFSHHQQNNVNNGGDVDMTG